MNFRDLGGLVTIDGKIIKHKRLLRSGELLDLPVSDITKLKEIYNLRKIVDFRSQSEVERFPDDTIDGVSYINIFLHENQTQKAVAPSQKEFRKLRERQLVIDFMTKVYDRMLRSPFTIDGFARFIKVVKDNKEGSILFHCYAGKDRTGVAAAIVYTILGVSKESIIEEYMLTNESRKEENERILAKAFEEDPDEKYIEALKVSYEVVPEYLEYYFSEAEKISGSLLQYIKDNMHISDEDIVEIRKNYLDD